MNEAKKQSLSLLIAGIIPVVLFTVIEDKYGVVAGLIAGMIFGLGEMIYEWYRYHKVSPITWIGNGMLLFLGAISLFTQDGLWFKLQPAILELFFFIFLLGSWLVGKPFLKIMIEKQNPSAPDFLKEAMGGMTFRLSLFFLIHCLLATYAAFYWSTENWALLKGVGLTLSMFFYMLIEGFFLRKKLK